MWFEGQVLVKEFPQKLAELLQTIPAGETEPLWQMVSSNVGEALEDDGYIFHSQGSSGKDSIYIGVKNAFTYNGSDSNWHYGHRFFIAENYIPNETSSMNGTLENILFNGHRYHFDTSWGGVTVDTMVLRYRISVTKDRVIITTTNNVALTLTQRINSISYLGLMNRYSEETDSTANIIATNYDYHYNVFRRIRALRNRQLSSGGHYQPSFNQFLNGRGLKGWGRKFFATHIPLHIPNEGFRGELDGMLVTYFENQISYQGRTVPEDGYVMIDGKKYLCLYKPYYHQNQHNNFDDGNTAYAYLIEVK